MNLDVLKKLTRFHWLIVIGTTTILLGTVFVYLTNTALNELGMEEDGPIPGFLLRSGNPDSFWTGIVDTRGKIAAENEIAGQYKAKAERLAAMQGEIDAARKRLPSAAEAQRAEMYRLIFGLTNQATSGTNSVSMKSFGIDFKGGGGSNRGRGGGGADIVKVEISTQIMADMDGMIHFINLIERHERFMFVESIQLTNGGVTTNLETKKIEFKPHSVNLKIVTYVDNSISSDGPKK